MNCTRCQTTGFLNIEHVPDSVLIKAENSDDFHAAIQAWAEAHHDDHDVVVCDCCGDGDGTWHGDPGDHNPSDFGKSGPYAYNGGRPECW